MKKKDQKESIDFRHEILTWKVRFWLLLTTAHYVNSQNAIISLEDIDFFPKIFLILYPSLENWTTRITIVFILLTGSSYDIWIHTTEYDQTNFSKPTLAEELRYEEKINKTKDVDASIDYLKNIFYFYATNVER